MTTLWRHVDAAIVGGGLPLGPALSAAAASFAARLCPGGALTLAHATLVPAADPGDDRAVTVTGTVDLPGAPAAAASLQVTGSAGAVQLALAIGPLPAGWQLSSIAPALPPSLTILDGVPTLAPSALAALALRGPSLALTAPDDDAALAAITARRAPIRAAWPWIARCSRAYRRSRRRCRIPRCCRSPGRCGSAPRPRTGAWP